MSQGVGTCASGNPGHTGRAVSPRTAQPRGTLVDHRRATVLSPTPESKIPSGASAPAPRSRPQLPEMACSASSIVPSYAPVDRYFQPRRTR